MSKASPSLRGAMRSLAPRWRLGLGLLVTPAAVALAGEGLPRLVVSENAANVIAFAGATLFPILGICLAAMVEVSLVVALSAAGVAAAVLITLIFRQPSPLVAVILVDSALVCLSWALGSSLGRRVQHEAHLLPACVVAASADIVSLLSPEGPSHAIAESERALSVLAVWFPVPGTLALAPALGVGDLLFMGLVFGAARAHGLPIVRCLVACAVGTALAGAAAAWAGIAVPALVPIAAVLVLALPAIRQLRPSDRAAARWAMLIAGSVVLATAVRALLSRHG